MIIKNGCIHDGKGNIFQSDIRILDGIIADIAEDLSPAEGEECTDASGLQIFPGFIQTLSFWGINGTVTEIRPSSEDNDELSDPITPHLDVRYAFNGRAATIQQLGAFGLTTVGVTPTDNNLFGGTMAVFEVDGVNPYRMCLKPYAGMKASVCKKLKDSYGKKRSVAPQTKMWIFSQLGEQLRLASEYKIEEGKERDPKLEAIRRVLTGELPLFISVDNEQDALHVMEITAPYRKEPHALKLVFCNCFGFSKDSDWLLSEQIPLVIRSSSMTMDDIAMTLDLPGIAALAEKGLPVALSGVDSPFQMREDVLWLGIAMMKILKDESKVLPMMTINPARLLGVDDRVGQIREGFDADLQIYDCLPTQYTTANLKMVMIDGKVLVNNK